MKAFVTILTCVAVAYHFLAGCCGHFALNDSPLPTPTVCQHSHCGHDHEAPAEEAPVDDRDQPCGHGECSATLTKAQVPVDQPVALLFAAITPDASTQGASASLRSDLAAMPSHQGCYLKLGRLLN